VTDLYLPSGSGPALSNHDRDILALLGREAAIQVSFQGLRRLLDIHQESLTRALRRLQEEGLVSGTTEGYRLSSQGVSLAQAVPDPIQSPPIPVLRTVLPGEREGRRASEVLRQRWFGPLRWYGSAEDAAGRTLTWTTEDGGIRLDARFEGVFLSVDGRLIDPNRLPEAVAAAHRILNEVTRAYMDAGATALPGPDS
jgi:DNA-binding Lrp family transcriptional regulator